MCYRGPVNAAWARYCAAYQHDDEAQEPQLIDSDVGDFFVSQLKLVCSVVKGDNK